MKTFIPMITLMVLALLVAPAMGEEEIQSLKSYYQAAIDEEIAQSRQMASLLSSRSPNLRQKGHREASMAMFLETNRESLVEDMLAQEIEPKTYRVERFLNDRFSCTCYSTWAAK